MVYAFTSDGNPVALSHKVVREFVAKYPGSAESDIYDLFIFAASLDNEDIAPDQTVLSQSPHRSQSVLSRAFQERGFNKPSSLTGTTVASAPVSEILLGHSVPLDTIAGAQQSLEALRVQVGCNDHLSSSVVDLPTSLFAPPKKASHPQHLLSDLVHKAKLMKLLASSHSQRCQLRLAAVTRPHAGSWLAALPIKQLGSNSTGMSTLHC